MSFLSPFWLLALLAIPPLLFLTWRIISKGQRLSPGRRRAFSVLRIASVLLLVLALAGLVLGLTTDRLSVLFLLDQSRSVSAEQRSRALSAHRDYPRPAEPRGFRRARALRRGRGA